MYLLKSELSKVFLWISSYIVISFVFMNCSSFTAHKAYKGAVQPRDNLAYIVVPSAVYFSIFKESNGESSKLTNSSSNSQYNKYKGHYVFEVTPGNYTLNISSQGAPYGLVRLSGRQSTNNGSVSYFLKTDEVDFKKGEIDFYVKPGRLYYPHFSKSTLGNITEEELNNAGKKGLLATTDYKNEYVHAIYRAVVREKRVNMNEPIKKTLDNILYSNPAGKGPIIASCLLEFYVPVEY